MKPFFTNDAIVFGLLMIVLAFVFHTSASDRPFWQRFYKIVPSLLLCYFLPALLNWPLGLISPEWVDDPEGLRQALTAAGVSIPPDATAKALRNLAEINDVDAGPFLGASKLYFMTTRYLLPASLILLTVSMDFKGIMRLGPKALIMFLAGTLGVILGGPIALLVVLTVAPDTFNVSRDELWQGLSTIAGSWIGGGANQTALREIFKVPGSLFGSMVIVDVVVANIWMGLLLYGAGITERIDRRLRADTSAIETLRQRMHEFQLRVARTPTTADIFVLMATAFGGVALSHWLADLTMAGLAPHSEALERMRLGAINSQFFWLVLYATLFGLGCSFTKARELEGVGASRWGGIFLYILVATVGMQMNLAEVGEHLGLFAIGFIWMMVHAIVLIITAVLIRAPFFFFAVGSQANIGGAASAPIVASAFSPVLAPVGVLLAVLGYAIGTYGGLLCALIMRSVAGG